MNATDKQRLERANRVAQVIAEHPDLPMMCLAPSTPSDYDSYYHDVYGASVRKMLFPLEVEKLYGGTFGIDPERYFDDSDEVEDALTEWLWDQEHGIRYDRATRQWVLKDGRTEGGKYDDKEWQAIYRPIARMMAEDMPWHEYIVIDCY